MRQCNVAHTRILQVEFPGELPVALGISLDGEIQDVSVKQWPDVKRSAFGLNSPWLAAAARKIVEGAGFVRRNPEQKRSGQLRYESPSPDGRSAKRGALTGRWQAA